MEIQDKITQQSKAAKLFKLLGKLFIGSIVLVIISVIVFLGPLPFIQPVWEANLEQRWRMLGSISRRISGLSLDEVQEILGSSYLSGHQSSGLRISYPTPRPWLSLHTTFETFETTMRLHEDMPEFTFIRIIEDTVPEPCYEIPQPMNVSILIMDERGNNERGNIIQSITGLTQSNVYGGIHYEDYDIAFEDFNFDGYLDMRLLRFQDGAGGRIVIEYIWLWDRETSQFILNQQLMDIENAGLHANQETQQLEAFHRVGADHFFTFYEYHYGEFMRVPDRTFLEGLRIYWDDGTTQFGSRVEGNTRVLYAVENYGLDIMQLAIFPSLHVEWGHSELESCRPQEIFSLDVVDDWIILSAGEIQGTMGNFFGDLHRVRRDGSGREAFQIRSMSSRFIIIDGWVYHHVWNVQSQYGWIRIRPDGTNKESMYDTIDTIITFGEDGYIYGTHRAGGWGNLARWQPESNEVVTLFLREAAPTFEEYTSINVSYGNITLTDEHVYFTVTVTGVYPYSELIGWRTPWETLYSGNYRVNKDGSNLTRVDAG